MLQHRKKNGKWLGSKYANHFSFGFPLADQNKNATYRKILAHFFLQDLCFFGGYLGHLKTQAGPPKAVLCMRHMRGSFNFIGKSGKSRTKITLSQF